MNNNKMKALYFDGSNLNMVEREIPKINENEVLIKVIKAGICSTDLEIMKGYQNFEGIPGHEFVGIVIESHNEELINKRVVGEINIPCHECEICKRGLTKHCRNIRTFGINNYDGCFAEYTKLPVENIHILPDEISDDYGTFVEPLAAALEIENYIEHDEKISLIGDGRLGLLIAMVLKIKGYDFLHIGKHEEKLKISKKMGIKTEMYNDDIVDEYKYNFDSVIEATGNESGLKTALDICIPSGKIILKSTFNKKINIDISHIVVNEYHLIGSRCGDFKKAIDFIRMYNPPLNDLISCYSSFDNSLKAIDEARKKIKVIINLL
ncbi:MAG: hypothetical protein PWQ77_1368 [Kosmotogales bacterium]|nr:hypothetical protein [Kosmotogales bacterium]